MAVTAKQIAKALGISPSTVSRVLNGRSTDFISEATRQRVLEAAREMNYRPHRAARALVTGKTGMVALWMYALDSSFHAQVIHLAERVLRRDRYDCLIYSLASDLSAMPSDSGQVDGILAHECIHQVRSFTAGIAGKSIPLVSCGCYYLTEVDHVGIDLRAGVTQAITHLLEIGCRRIAYLVNASSNHPGECRGEAYRHVLHDAGLEPELIIAPDQSRVAARDAVREYLEQHPAPDGIFCHNDQMAIGAYKALRDAGVRIPDDTAIVGCDGIEETEFLEIPLSTIVQPLEEMCQLSWEFLKWRMGQPNLPVQSAVLRPRFVIRESTMR